MRQIILFLKRQKDFFVFLVLFLIAFAFTFNANSFQKSRYLHAANFVSGSLYGVTSSVSNYFNLNYQNNLLVDENKRLHQELLDIQRLKLQKVDVNTEVSFSTNQYKVLRGEIIKNSVNLSKNYLIINKGQKDSVYQDMGVISSKGIVGIVDKTSGRFASVQSVLNVRSKISAALKKTGHYGTLCWTDNSLNIVQLIEIPNVAPVKVGDTIVTDGRSSIFPKGIPVGKVKNFHLNQLDNSLTLNVELFTDMSNIQHVYIIKNREQEAIRELEKEIEKSIDE